MNNIKKIGQDPSEEYSDMPIDWDASDIQMLKKWDENTIREFMGLPLTFTAIYKTIVNVNELNPRLADGEEEEEDWDEFRKKTSGFPPIVIIRTTTGKLKIANGNHRVYWAEQNGYRTIGVWVVDKLLQKDIDKKNERKIKETRIITPEESLEEGYITLYHGTIWPIALKAKKGELGPQNLEKLITDVLINVFHETPKSAKSIYDREMKTHSVRQEPDRNVLFLTTNKESAEGYAKACTKYGGEIFLDVLGGYLWEKDKDQDYKEKVIKYLQTNEPAVVTINVPISMVHSSALENTTKIKIKRYYEKY